MSQIIKIFTCFHIRTPKHVLWIHLRMMFIICSSIHMCELKYIGSFIYIANEGRHVKILSKLLWIYHSIIFGIPIFVDLEDSIKQWNIKYNEYLSLCKYICICTDYSRVSTNLHIREHNIFTAYPSGTPEFTPGFSGVRILKSLVLCVCFVDRCLSFFFLLLCCLFFDLRILITSLVSSNSSLKIPKV